MKKKNKKYNMDQLDLIHSIDSAIDNWVANNNATPDTSVFDSDTTDLASIEDAISDIVDQRRSNKTFNDDTTTDNWTEDDTEKISQMIWDNITNSGTIHYNPEDEYQFKGTKDYASELPSTGNTENDVWRVLYRGTSGTKALNALCVWKDGYWRIAEPINDDTETFLRLRYGDSAVDEEETESDSDDVNESDVENYKGLQIYYNKIFHTVTFFDGINSISVNLAAIPQDSKNLNVDNFEGLCSLFLWTEITNFYPSAILTSGKFSDICNIGEYDQDKFGFYDNGNDDKIIFAYYLDNDSYNAWMDVCKNCADSKTIGGFIVMLTNILNDGAFSFRALLPYYRTGLSMIKDYSEKSSVFMGKLFADADTELADVPNGNVYDAIQVLPFNYSEMTNEGNIFADIASPTLFYNEASEAEDLNNDDDEDDDEDLDDEDDDDIEIDEEEMLEESSESDIDKILDSVDEDSTETKSTDEDEMTFGGNDKNDDDDAFTVKRRQ